MPNVTVTYAEMHSAARQLQAGEQAIEGDPSKLKRLVANLVAGGYVTDASSRQFEASYAQFRSLRHEERRPASESRRALSAPDDDHAGASRPRRPVTRDARRGR